MRTGTILLFLLLFFCRGIQAQTPLDSIAGVNTGQEDTVLFDRTLFIQQVAARIQADTLPLPDSLLLSNMLYNHIDEVSPSDVQPGAVFETSSFGTIADTGTYLMQYTPDFERFAFCNFLLDVSRNNITVLSVEERTLTDPPASSGSSHFTPPGHPSSPPLLESSAGASVSTPPRILTDELEMLEDSVKKNIQKCRPKFKDGAQLKEYTFPLLQEDFDYYYTDYIAHHTTRAKPKREIQILYYKTYLSEHRCAN